MIEKFSRLGKLTDLEQFVCSAYKEANFFIFLNVIHICSFFVFFRTCRKFLLLLSFGVQGTDNFLKFGSFSTNCILVL